MSERVVITGTNRGLGLELARIYAGRGDEVWAGCRQPAQATELASLTEHVETVDVGSEDSIAAFADALGAAPIDILFNNAGIDALGTRHRRRRTRRAAGQR